MGKGILIVFFSVITLSFVNVISPTWWYATRLKEGLGKEERAEGIIARNYLYLLLSIVMSLLLGFFYEPNEVLHSPLVMTVVVYSLFYLVTWSRCNEILFAFIQDALDKSENSPSKSNLTHRKRIELSLLSYIELILNYSILFLIMPNSWFNEELVSIVDSIYLSGVTITTLGYGDFSPTHWLPKFLVIHEVLAGFTLIIVSFSLYAGKEEVILNKS